MVYWRPDFAADQQIVLAQPYRRDVWRQSARPARKCIDALAQLLRQYHPICLLTPQTVSYDDIWMRDILPLWYQEDAGQWRGLLMEFDGWGDVQQTIEQDSQLPEQLFADHLYPVSKLIGEGGMLTHNGQVALMGLAALKSRQPELTQRQLSRRVEQSLAGLDVHFFDGKLSADETSGHMDNLALFIAEDTLIYCATDDVSHPDYETCQKLAETVAQLPEHIAKVALPLPLPQQPREQDRAGIMSDGNSLVRDMTLPICCSYTNLIVTDKVIVVPEFELPTDAEVFAIIQRHAGGRKVLSHPARELVLGGGGLHCVSHQVPADIPLPVI
ncbi:agmatine deiminase [Idiomarina fontislapidosi]|uniref:Agmatine deiminase family protein n=1 Tax=Idiomarina fontislapidosi TaxID=263723 RepID=A0A432XXK9_9GAMM|nr:agmatine deiminase family protein [Idiomarina fontislapidosi]PYE32107.1 agmatine deiminase [Idiomarina fontislapidosi]RUO53311.1 agmatine deiminase family protein [Idiomarina fontislapidosi]